MIVVGGAYRERVSYPPTDEFFGSGLKAAASLASLSKGIKLYSAVSSVEEAQAKSTALSYNINPNFFSRENPITFSYVTPLAKPLIIGEFQKKIEIVETSDVALVFGMLESTPQVQARRLIFDPQSPRSTTIPPDLSDRSKHLSIVLNYLEITGITGIKDIEKAANKLIQKTNAKVVVVKCGALGAIVKTCNNSAWVGAHPTASVWPLGSGDVFSAVFAWAWGEKEYSAIEAAKLASGGAAIWCGTKMLPLPSNLSRQVKKLKKPLQNKSPYIYLAAPFFSVSDTWLVEVTKSALQDLGAKVFSPLHDVGRGQDEVAKEDLKGLEKCSAILALLDGEDTGTLFEVGYAIAQRKPVVAFTTFKDSWKFKMLRGSGIEIYDCLSTAIYQAIWTGCENCD